MLRLKKFFNSLLLLTLLIPLLGASDAPVAQSVSATLLRIQSGLTQLAADAPDRTLSVIIQKRSAEQDVEALVLAQGGQIIRDFSFINAFAAELPAASLMALAQHDDVRWISANAEMQMTQTDEVVASGKKPQKNEIDRSKLETVFPEAIGATALWNQTPNAIQGDGVTVAVVDSGVQSNNDLKQHLTSANFSKSSPGDKYGHGTFVAGIIAGTGKGTKGSYVGVAPGADLVNVKVVDDDGFLTEADVIASLQWIYENKDEYNIRVVNLSLTSTTPQSYHTSPLNAAVEILWFNGIVVVVSAGNSGADQLYPPANDPFVITVGATNDYGTATLDDDTVAFYSSYGKTLDGFSKPDLVAPGHNIKGYLPKNDKLTVGREHPVHRVGGNGFRMSGTSMAAPIVSGAVALLLQDEPELTPDQVKYRLMATANQSWPGYDPVSAGAGYLDIYAAVHGDTTESANTGTPASQLLWSGSEPVNWTSVNWNSVNWNAVNWNAVNWNAVNWNAVNWNADHWDDEVGDVNGSTVTDAMPDASMSDDEDAATNEATESSTATKLFLPLVSR